jgi:flagellar motor switch/type III secretory pathway protein FliN
MSMAAASVPFRAQKREVARLMARALPAVHAHRITNSLYAARGLRVDGHCWYWQLTRPRIREWVVLGADDLRLLLAFDGDAVGLATRQLDWRRYSGETRLLAWTAVHEPVIGLLRVLFQCDWMPQVIDDAAAPGEGVRAGFVVQASDGQPIANGVLQLDAPCLQRLATRAPLAEPRISPALLAVRTRLPVVLDEFTLDAAELAAVSRGAIIRLDNRTLAGGAARVAIPAGRTRLIADVTGTCATIVGQCTSIPKESPMSHEPPTAGAAPDGSASAPQIDRGVAVGALPVRLGFTAGHLSLPFAALADVGAGFVFELGKQLDDQVITIEANDVPIALGELVVIGDLVGVRITRMLPRT